MVNLTIRYTAEISMQLASLYILHIILFYFKTIQIQRLHTASQFIFRIKT